MVALISQYRDSSLRRYANLLPGLQCYLGQCLAIIYVSCFYVNNQVVLIVNGGLVIVSNLNDVFIYDKSSAFRIGSAYLIFSCLLQLLCKRIILRLSFLQILYFISYLAFINCDRFILLLFLIQY